MKISPINAADMVKNTTLVVNVKLKGVKRFKIRIKIATLLLRIAALVLNCGIKIEEE